MTKVEKFDAIIAFLNDNGADVELVECIEGEKASALHKAEKAKERAAEKKAAGDELRGVIESLLTTEPQTADDLLAQIDGEDLTRAKVISRVAQLVKLGLASKSQIDVNGRKAMAYTLPVEG